MGPSKFEQSLEVQTEGDGRTSVGTSPGIERSGSSKMMKLKLTGLLTLVGLSVGCSGGGDSCASSNGASCDEEAPSTLADPVGGPLECTETIAFGCDADGVCSEVHQRSCPGGVVEKTLEPGCRKGPPGGGPAYTFDTQRSASREAFAFALQEVVNGRLVTTIRDPWGAAIDQFNALFNDGVDPRLSFAEPVRGGGQGPAPTPKDIIEFRIFNNGVIDDFPNASGLTSCGENEIFGRHNCIVSLIMDNIRRSAEVTGNGIQEIANSVALHELGHVSCIQHFARDSAVPTPFPIFSAMNSFMLIDSNNAASRYFTYDSSEIADARQAFEDGQTIPDTVFERGFNAD
jgi:hypothetical protein